MAEKSDQINSDYAELIKEMGNFFLPVQTKRFSLFICSLYVFLISNTNRNAIL